MQIFCQKIISIDESFSVVVFLLESNFTNFFEFGVAKFSPKVLYMFETVDGL